MMKGKAKSNRGRKLRELVKRVWENVPHYRAKMEDVGVTPHDISTARDLWKLPFTTKEDLRNTYPSGLLACSKEKTVRFHASSGTTGKPTVVAYTRNDLQTWTDAMASCLKRAGVTSSDVVQIAYGYGLFTGGLGLHYGAEKLGCAVIPASGGFSERQLMLMEDLGTSVLACTPSYALKLSEMLQQKNKALKLRLGIFGAEPWSETLRKTLEENLKITALDVYGLSEVMGPGVAMECPAKTGLHLAQDFFLVEIINPETGQPVKEGDEGELVITTLTKEALPLIRYRTRDITKILPGKCDCGDSSTRIARIRGRSDEMLIIRGVNIFPTQVEAALGKTFGLSCHYYLEVTGSEGHKDLHVYSEMLENLSPEAEERLKAKAISNLHNILGIRVELHLLPPGSIERSDGKSKRIRSAL